MLNQLDIYIKRADLTDVWSDLAVKVHGFIMSRIPSEFAAECHNGKVQPFSVFCFYGEEYGIIRISTLTDKAKMIIDAMKKVRTIRVFGSETNIEVIRAEENPEISFDDLEFVSDTKMFRWQIISPAMYRSGGKLHFDFNFPAYFDSVIQKIEAFEGLKITRDRLNSLFSNLEITKYNLRSDKFITGKRLYLGMTGNIGIRIEENNEDTKLLKKILCYATYSGIGNMTTQGMGGNALQIIKKEI